MRGIAIVRRIVGVIVLVSVLAWGYFKIQAQRDQVKASQLNNRAVELINEAQYQRAIELLEQARRLAPEKAEIRENLEQARQGARLAPR